jgi:uncharacterized protein (TIGR03905 family)
VYKYKTTGTCAQEIIFQIIDGKIYTVNFLGGCSGNLIGVSKLIEGMGVQEAIKRLKGITCGSKSTSCPDQLAQALETATSQIK